LPADWHLLANVPPRELARFTAGTITDATANDPVGGLGVYGAWNVGDWVKDVEGRYLETAI
jgi:hypothetical protein